MCVCVCVCVCTSRVDNVRFPDTLILFLKVILIYTYQKCELLFTGYLSYGNLISQLK